MKSIKAVIAGKVYSPSHEITDAVVLIEGSRITRVGPRSKVKVPRGAEVLDHRKLTLVPGFIDVHIHGACGNDFMDGTIQSVTSAAKFLARKGTTSFLASTVTAGVDNTFKAIRALSEAIRTQHLPGESGQEQPPAAELLGIHFEGPFLNAKRPGAQPAEHVQPPSVELLRKFIDAADGHGMAITLAPEVEGAMALLKYARRRGVRVAIGHSDATVEEAERALDAGATHATHTFNAMRPFNHRDPGIIGAVLADDRVLAELICDGVHVHPGAVRLLAKSKGLEHILLISDGGPGTGRPDGNYRIHNFDVTIVDGVCRNLEGHLAGSTTTLDAELRNLAKFTGSSYADVLPCATKNPARLLGLEKRKGVIAPGADADMVALDAKYRVVQTYVRGRPVL